VVGEDVPHLKVSDMTDQSLLKVPLIFLQPNPIKSANGMIVVGVGDGQRSQEGAT
jgi:hypothetical protein